MKEDFELEFDPDALNLDKHLESIDNFVPKETGLTKDSKRNNKRIQSNAKISAVKKELRKAFSINEKEKLDEEQIIAAQETRNEKPVAQWQQVKGRIPQAEHKLFVQLLEKDEVSTQEFFNAVITAYITRDIGVIRIIEDFKNKEKQEKLMDSIRITSRDKDRFLDSFSDINDDKGEI